MDHELPGLYWLDELPELVQAAARGESDRVVRLLAAGIDSNQADDDGWTALHAAALFNHFSVVMLLLDAGAQVDARTTGPDGGFTPLLNAATASGPVVTALLAAGADPMAQENGLGWRPLQRFVQYGNLKAARLVIDAGADVNAADFAGDTALMDAADYGQTPCVRLLLHHGADATMTNDDGDTAASIAAGREYHEIADLLAAAIPGDTSS